MVADLPATYVGITRAARAFRRESRDVQSVLSVLAEGRTKEAYPKLSLKKYSPTAAR